MKVPGIDRVNRVLLVAVGIIAFAVGVGILLHSTGALGRRRADSPVISSPTARWYGEQGPWLWPTIGVASLVVVGLCVWWISAQLRSRGGDRLELTRATDGALTVSTNHLEDCLERDAASYDEIHRARARVNVDDETVLVDLTVAVQPPYDVGRAVARITSTVLPHLAVTLDEEHPRPIRTSITIEAAEAAMTRLR